MKKIFISLLSIVSISLTAQNTVTMLHHAGNKTPYYGNSGFNDAYTAAVNGDTIYLPGKYFSPPALIDKRLVIIGTGHFPDSTSATEKTFIQGAVYIGENADGSQLEGLYINGGIIFQNNIAANNVLIKRNFINGDLNIQGDRSNTSNEVRIFENVIMYNLHGDNSYHLIAANNIITSVVRGVYNGSVLNNIIFGNVYYGYPYYDYYDIFDCNNTLLENNIITGTSGSGMANCTNDVFNNNVYCRNQNFGSNSNSNNYVSQSFSSLFINAAGASFDYTYDYHLQTPGSYTGTDATQAGLYGGLFGPAKVGAVPFNPHISQKTISNTTDSNGKLNINIKVNAQTK